MPKVKTRELDTESVEALEALRPKLPAYRSAKDNRHAEGDVVEGAALGTVVAVFGDTLMVMESNGIIHVLKYREVWPCQS